MILKDKILTNFTANSTSFSGFVYNAKEKDNESGFHYYGSRYYSSELSIWNSTDPMADKYPSLTPYNYCANNPVKLIDPNGEEIWLLDDDGNKTKLLTIKDINRDSHDRRIQIIKQIYNSGKEGKDLINELMSKDVSISIKPTNEFCQGGEVSQYLEVSWGNANGIHGGSDAHILAEELYHCKQIKDKKWNFDEKQRQTQLSLEVDAKEFATRTFPDFNRFFEVNGFYVPTEMNIMSSGYDRSFKIDYLDKNKTTNLPMYMYEPNIYGDTQSTSRIYKHKGAY